MEQDDEGTMLIRSLDDVVEAVYLVALNAYQAATGRAHRLDNAQHGRPVELQDPELWHEQDNAWSVVDQCRRNLIETAPDEATSWWPGAWLGVSEFRRFGYRGLPGQIDGMNVWPTEDAARAGRPEWVPAEKWTVTWTPTARNEFGEIPLDAAFWAEQPETPPPAPAAGQAGVPSHSILPSGGALICGDLKLSKRPDPAPVSVRVGCANRSSCTRVQAARRGRRSGTRACPSSFSRRAARRVARFARSR